MEKSSKFMVELSYIKDSKIRESCKIMLDLLPDYFYDVPASSAGKYHPTYALGSGGLLRHVKAATRIAYELLGNPIIGDNYTAQEKDLMLMAIILHDGLKSGLNHAQYTVFDHPVVMAKYLEENKDKLMISAADRKFVEAAIITHMGPWTKDYQGNEVLTPPKTKYQKFVHMCDFLASRKFLKVDFDTTNNIVD